MPRASVIITTHNRPHLITRAINSARTAGSNVEVIVVDDASSDETALVCRGISGIHYIRLDKNHGVAGARNAGIVASSGEYISFLDDDDTRLEGTLDRQVEALETDSAVGLVYGKALLKGTRKQFDEVSYPAVCPQGDIYWPLLSRNFIPCGSAVFSRDCIYRLGMLDESISGIDDWDLWVRIAEIYPVIALETPVVTWRRSTPVSGQGSSHAAQLVSLAINQFHQRWLKLPRTERAPEKKKRDTWKKFSENMADHLVWEAARSLKYRNLQQAVRNVFALRRLHAAALAKLLSTRAKRAFNHSVMA